MAAKITIIGLGSGDENQLSLGIWRKIQEASRLCLRTGDHPVVRFLEKSGIPFQTFDSVYEQETDFSGVYERIAAELVKQAESGTPGEEIVYAVPGHPSVAERTTQLLRLMCPAAGVELNILGGESFLDQAFLRLGFDPVEGFQLLDATDPEGFRLEPRLHTLITQVYDPLVASDVKLNLMELYPDDYTVVVGHALGVPGDERILEVPLFELDRVEGYGNLSLIWVPRTDREDLRNRTFSRLHEIIAILRSPEGCPWDREQTHASLRKNLIEETYEVLETIEEDDPDHMCEELGDLLLQIMLHAQMEEETGAFTVYDVIAALNEKLIRRHPHVFGENSAADADEALENWQEIKKEEKQAKGIGEEETSVLDGIPRELPPLMKAWKLQKKASTVGFDWDNLDDVWAKVQEELGELRAVLSEEATDERREELGDLLFAIVNLARFLKVDPEEALSLANRKFIERFHYIERKLRLKGKSLDKTDLQEMEFYWQEAKKEAKK